jgi:hypothetical protein
LCADQQQAQFVRRRRRHRMLTVRQIPRVRRKRRAELQFGTARIPAVL